MLRVPHELPPLPLRPADGHKGTFGSVCVIGGQAATPRVMLGGPAFAALGALRAGAGLAVLAVPSPLMNEALVIAPSATGLALPVDEYGELLPSESAKVLDEFLAGPSWNAARSCLAIGPGLGAGIAQQQVVARLIARDDGPIVIDADAINALAALREFHLDLRAPAVLTPHPGEYQRLAKALNIDADPVDPARREEAARTLAQRLGCVVVLKGAGTIVSDGLECWINASGNVALATAGSGDVLAGVIAGLIAQHFRATLGTGLSQAGAAKRGLSLLDCARWGVYLHGLAADRWAARHGTAGMLATDLLEEIPSAIESVRIKGPDRNEPHEDTANTER
jgi:NAD(P)H-hydrate epimerase